MLKKREEQINIRDIFSVADDVPNDEMVSDLMNGMIEASTKQSELAIELTKVVLNKLNRDMTEDEIFAIFRKSTQIVCESIPLKGFWNKFESDMN